MEENPFTPLFGQIPLCVAGRDAFLREMTRAFQGPSSNPNLSTLIVGPRGTGKTVLLSRIATLARENGWVVASVSANTGMLEDILQRSYESASHLLSTPSAHHISSLTMPGGIGASWETRPVQENWRTQMNRVFEQLSHTGTGLLITVDELNADCPEMTTLATTYQHFLSEGRHVSLVMAGLPGNVSNLVNGKSTSFWRRARQQHLGRIADADLATAFQQTLAAAHAHIDDAALRVAVSEIDGFAYLMQLVGYWAFEDMAKTNRDVMNISHVRAGIKTARTDMRNSVLSSTYADLSEGDIRFLEAMLHLSAPATMRDIAAHMGVSQGYASQYRLRLIAQGVIGTRGRGKLDFEIPFFREYVQEATEFAAWEDQVYGGQVSKQAWAEAQDFATSISDEVRHG